MQGYAMRTRRRFTADVIPASAGTCLGVAKHARLSALGIHDEEVTTPLRDTEAYINSR